MASGRASLDACIKGLEDSLGVAAPKVTGGPRAPAASSVSAQQLLDSTIAALEASLALRPGESLPVSSVSNGKSNASSKPAGEGKGKGKDKIGEKKANNARRKEGRGSKAAGAGASTADQPEGTKVDLRVGLITRVWTHETADKLYCEEIDVGEGAPRQIASGLVPHYSLEEMGGRRVVVMCNLKPRNLKGFKSQGMVVCAVAALGDGKVKVELVVPPEAAEVGERLSFGGVTGGPFEPSSAAQMEKKKVLDKVLPELTTDAEGIVKWREHPLGAPCGPCIAPTVRNGAVR